MREPEKIKKSELIERQLRFEGKPISFKDYPLSPEVLDAVKREPLLLGGRSINKSVMSEEEMRGLGTGLNLFKEIDEINKQIILGIAVPKEYIHGELSSYSGAEVARRESEAFQRRLNGLAALRRSLGLSGDYTGPAGHLLQEGIDGIPK